MAAGFGTEYFISISSNTKRIATERAFDALQEYCFHGHQRESGKQ